MSFVDARVALNSRGSSRCIARTFARDRLPYRMHAHSLQLVIALALFAIASPIRAQNSVFIDELTSPELAALVRHGKTIALVPIGGTEQSGPHMVLGKHNVRVKVLAAKIAAALGNALVAPVVAYVPEGNVNPPTAHMRFPGTITVPAQTFESVLEYAARSLRQSGFSEIVFLGDHGGYQRNEESVALKLNREWSKTPYRVHALVSYYRAVDNEYRQVLKARGFSDAEIGIHAGLADTSLALAVDPQLVRTTELSKSASRDAGNGVTGDPRRASAELGNLGVDAIVRTSVATIRATIAKR
jgi:creatinine amidohydrolase/Fe(II)-dependent formamide hydrolase-like protein